jgi:tetratricopeptide (TPR) repeat protein
VQTFFPSRLRRRRPSVVSPVLVAVIALVFAASVAAQAAGAASQSNAAQAADAAPQVPGAPSARSGRILLVLPFDNNSGQPSLEWIREAAAELLSSRFASAGFSPLSREDRNYALDHLGLPEGFHPSRASSIKIAETLDADSIIVGSFTTQGDEIIAQASVVDMPHLRMSLPVDARGKLTDMIAVFDSLAWKLTRQLDPSFNVAEETFIAAGARLRLDAFEQFIRGITDPDQAERLRHLNQAVHLSPSYSQAWMALGREDYLDQKYDQAAAAFAKVDRNDPDALEAGFYRGLSLLFSGDYPRAAQAFSDVARILPLAEVLNNEGVAVSRQGQNAIALFRQAVAADPDTADYHFNLAVSLRRYGRNAEALSELAQCLHLRPNDSEAQSLQEAWKARSAPLAASADPGAKEEPLERIARNFDEVAFRQAAQMLDQMDEARMAKLSPRERALQLSARARDYLNRGLLLEAERLYLSAQAADNQVAEAHAGLAQVRELAGNNDAARKQANIALTLQPSADAYLVLGRLDLAAGNLTEANREAREALKLDPASQPAQELLRQILNRSSRRN